MDQYVINMDSSIPIYQQIVDAVCADIRSGKLPAGSKLTTVRELADQMKVARGTVKRAYDELGKMGIVEMNQGRGTYVRYQPENADSRKERAMAAIEKTLDLLEDLKFSTTEIDIFLDLKLRERAQRKQDIRVALAECSPEVLAHLTELLRRRGDVDVYPYLLEDVLSYPYKIGEEMDVIVTSVAHAEALQDMISEKEKIIKVALIADPKFIIKIAVLKPGKRIGILSKSRRFGELLQEICRNYAKQAVISQPYAFDGVKDCEIYLKDKDVVLVPEAYERFCSRRDAELLNEFERKNDLIPCTYQIDQGSFIYLEERLNELKKKKI